MKKILFVQGQESWVNVLKKVFGGNYDDAEFDFRRTPRAAVGRFIWGLRYDVVLIDYGWSVKGLKKQIEQLSPQSAVYTYSQIQQKRDGMQLIKKDIKTIKQALAMNGVVR